MLEGEEVDESLESVTIPLLNLKIADYDHYPQPRKHTAEGSVSVTGAIDDEDGSNLTPDKIVCFEAHSHPLQIAKFSWDGKWLATASEEVYLFFYAFTFISSTCIIPPSDSLLGQIYYALDHRSLGTHCSSPSYKHNPTW